MTATRTNVAPIGAGITEPSILPFTETLAGLGGPVDPYRATFEGGTDHDVLYATLVRRLDVPAMSRFIAAVAPT